MTMQSIGSAAKAAASQLMTATTAQKDAALKLIAQKLGQSKADILKHNQQDIENAKSAGLKPSFIERLTLTEARIDSMVKSIDELLLLPDPVGKYIDGAILENGLNIQKIAVPFGVIGIIYESRPNVTVDAACLCLKSGNAAILKGGIEAENSNKILTAIMQEALAEAGFAAECIQLYPDSSIEGSKALMQAKGYIDVLIPRGGQGLIRAVVDNSTVPVIETGAGNCHVYIDKAADKEMAINIIDNAKNSRPSVCNAAETLLIHEAVAAEFLPEIKARMANFNTELRGCQKTCEILGDSVRPATDEDFATEFNDYILAVKIVSSIDEAIAHIRQYTTGHSEAIITEDYEAKLHFTSHIDAAAVYVNASTRFTDGGCFGLGAEIGISTQKLHVRGPMGLQALTACKYVIFGNGQIR